MFSHISRDTGVRGCALSICSGRESCPGGDGDRGCPACHARQVDMVAGGAASTRGEGQGIRLAPGGSSAAAERACQGRAVRAGASGAVWMHQVPGQHVSGMRGCMGKQPVSLPLSSVGGCAWGPTSSGRRVPPAQSARAGCAFSHLLSGTVVEVQLSPNSPRC